MQATWLITVCFRLCTSHQKGNSNSNFMLCIYSSFTNCFNNNEKKLFYSCNVFENTLSTNCNNSVVFFAVLLETIHYFIYIIYQLLFQTIFPFPISFPQTTALKTFPADPELHFDLSPRGLIRWWGKLLGRGRVVQSFIINKKFTKSCNNMLYDKRKFNKEICTTVHSSMEHVIKLQ